MDKPWLEFDACFNAKHFYCSILITSQTDLTQYCAPELRLFDLTTDGFDAARIGPLTRFSSCPAGAAESARSLEILGVAMFLVVLPCSL